MDLPPQPQPPADYQMLPQPASHLPPPVSRVVNQVIDKLRALAIAHYVLGGFICLIGLFPMIHVILGGLFVFGGVAGSSSGAGAAAAPITIVGGIFMVIGGAIVLAFQAMGIATIYAGMGLWKQERYTYCLVMAAVLCTLFPFGTVVGVFTLVCILSPEGKMAFETPYAAVSPGMPGLTPGRGGP